MRKHFCFWAIALLAAGVVVGAGQLFSQEGDTPSFANLTDKEMEEFLLHAEVIDRRGIPVGITRPERFTLSDGKLTHDAQFQTVEIYRAEFQTALGREINFRDSYKFNIAAYRLDRLLNLGMIPVSVERKVDGKTGAMTWWIDDVQMMERERRRKKMQPPDPANWNDQMYQVRVFRQLAYDTDINLTNLMITNDWNIWMVDFSRAFRLYRKLATPGDLVRIDRGLLERLRGLDLDTLMRELQPYLRKGEINGLLARRDRIVELFDEKIAKEGEAAVLCDMQRR